jgi:hypothetical protein
VLYQLVLAEAVWRFTWKEVIGRFHLPGRFHDATMDLRQLRQGDVRIATLGVTVAGLRVDPLGGVGVALHLEVLRQLLVADRLARVEEPAHLLEQSVFPSIAVELWAILSVVLIEFGDFAMMRRMLKGIRRRAEAAARGRHPVAQI